MVSNTRFKNCVARCIGHREGENVCRHFEIYISFFSQNNLGPLVCTLTGDTEIQSVVWLESNIRLQVAYRLFSWGLSINEGPILGTSIDAEFCSQSNLQISPLLPPKERGYLKSGEPKKVTFCFLRPIMGLAFSQHQEISLALNVRTLLCIFSKRKM